MVLRNPIKHQEGKTIVYFVRHGDASSKEDYNKAYPGPGLSDLGKKQAKEVAQQFARIKEDIDVLYSSTMARALETAQAIENVIHKQPLVEHGLCEVNKVLWTKKYHLLGYWRTVKKYLRAKKTLNKILQNNRGKVIVIVAHGGIIRALLGWKFGLSFKQRGSLDHHNCHITLVRFKGTTLDYIHYFNSKGLA